MSSQRFAVAVVLPLGLIAGVAQAGGRARVSILPLRTAGAGQISRSLSRCSPNSRCRKPQDRADREAVCGDREITIPAVALKVGGPLQGSFAVPRRASGPSPSTALLRARMPPWSSRPRRRRRPIRRSSRAREGPRPVQGMPRRPGRTTFGSGRAGVPGRMIPVPRRPGGSHGGPPMKRAITLYEFMHGVRNSSRSRQRHMSQRCSSLAPRCSRCSPSAGGTRR